MTNELTVQSEFTQSQIQLIRDTVAKNATDDELKLFLYRCKSMDLDPLKPGQIYFIKYGSTPGTMVVGIDGFRAKADRTGKLAGIRRGVIRDEKFKCIGAWAEVYRKDWTQPAREEVSLSEYSTGKNLWARMPETMVKKVAEVAALRMAFPDSLGGMYSHEEMDQAKESPLSIKPGDPGVGNGNTQPRNGIIKFGQFAMRHPSEVDHKKLEEYYFSLENRSQKDDKLRNDERVKETLQIIGDYLAAQDKAFEESEKV